MTSDRKTHIVVLGAGFAGISASRALLKAGLAVTLIDHHPYNTFQPLLYQVATGGLNPGDITYPLRTFVAKHTPRKGRKSRLRYRRSSVVSFDKETRTVHCDDGVNVGYDYLLICNGTTANFFGIPGAEQYAMPMYTRADALKVRDTLFGGLERIAGMSDPGTGGFTTLIVGGGATGVEMAGTLAEMRDVSLPRAYPELNQEKLKVVLVEMAPQLLTPFAKSLQDYTYRQLERRHVEIRLGTEISLVHPDRVDFSDGTSMSVDLVVWAAGIAAYNRVKDWDLPQGKGGRIRVGEDLMVVGEDRIFAAGDTAVNPDDPLPQLAQPAIQGGQHVARQIIHLLNGEPTQAFRYHDKGSMATIGELAAVVEFPKGLAVRGPIAWVLWLGVHIMSLLGGRNRLTTMINLSARYLSFRKGGGIVGDIRDTNARKAIDDKAY